MSGLQIHVLGGFELRVEDGGPLVNRYALTSESPNFFVDEDVLRAEGTDPSRYAYDAAATPLTDIFLDDAEAEPAR